MFAPFQYVEDCFLSVIDHICGLYLGGQHFPSKFPVSGNHSKLLGVKAKVVVVDGVPICLEGRCDTTSPIFHDVTSLSLNNYIGNIGQLETIKEAYTVNDLLRSVFLHSLIELLGALSVDTVGATP